MSKETYKFTGLIGKYKAINKITDIIIANKMGVSIATWYVKKSQPLKLTWLEILEVQKILKIPTEELVDALF